MGGRCLGGLLVSPRFLDSNRHRCRLRDAGAGIGACGLLVMWRVPLLGGDYTSWAGTGPVSLVLRAAWPASA